MGQQASKQPRALGFFTVLEHPKHGSFGGYLVLNTTGRPLEFHCTAPIQPNRAQEILYGPTLEAFLYGEQIGRTLLAKAKIEAMLVCTVREPALAVREHISQPVAMVLSPETPPETPSADREGQQKIFRFDATHNSGGPHLLSFEVGGNRLAVPKQADDDRGAIERHLGELPESFDLNEPFGRIREAIEEAQKAVR